VTMYLSLRIGILLLLRIVNCRWVVSDDAVWRQFLLERKDLQFLKASEKNTIRLDGVLFMEWKSDRESHSRIWAWSKYFSMATFCLPYRPPFSLIMSDSLSFSAFAKAYRSSVHSFVTESSSSSASIRSPVEISSAAKRSASFALYETGLPGSLISV